MKKAKIELSKAKDGSLVISVKKKDMAIELDVTECCLISDAIDEKLFGTKPTGQSYIRRARGMVDNEKIQPMHREEMHDLLYHYDYRDGSSFTKAMSIKMVKMIDLGKVKTFGEMFRLYKNTLSCHKTIKG